MALSFYDSVALCYSTRPWERGPTYIQVNPDSVRAELTVSADMMRKMLCIHTNNNEKETKKMKAKKCDRCGKLYENPVNGENCGAEVRFRYLPVDGEENLSEKKIIEKQTKNIYISSLSVDVDICPDCRESFKRWFENG